MKPKWKPGHPTEDGVYWLSVTPKHREPTHWEQPKSSPVWLVLVNDGFCQALTKGMKSYPLSDVPRCDDVMKHAEAEFRSNWTPDRPTKPGEYWLSRLPPKQRTNQRSAIPVVCHPCGGILGVYDGITGEWLNAVMSSALDGAIWAPRETPADPFEEG